MLEHGITDLSLRPLAHALNTSPRMLLYYFGSKENLLTQVVRGVRADERNEVAATLLREGRGGPRLPAPKTMQHMLLRDEGAITLFFELFAMALRDRATHEDFLEQALFDWLDPLRESLVRAGVPKKNASAVATILTAAFRGFAMDYLATRDLQRIRDAYAVLKGLLEEYLADVVVAAPTSRDP